MKKDGDAAVEPVISVIIPVYNSEKYIEKCVDSVCSQTVQNIQIILVDDCSSDHSFEYCRKLALNDPRIEVYRQEKNRGVSAARNLGLSLAKGKYILFADADDELDPDMFELLVGMIEEDPLNDLAVCGYYIDNTPQTNPREKKSRMGRLEAAKAAAGKQGSLVKGYVVNKLFKKELIVRENLRFDEDTYICEDLLFCQQYIWYCKNVYYVQDPKYHYLAHAESAMHGRVTDRRMSVLDTFYKIMEVGHRYGDSEMDDLLDAGYQNHYVSILKDVVKNPSKEQKNYGDVVFPYIKQQFFIFLKNKHVTFKRKVLIILLRIVYPFWRMLPASNR